MTSLRGWAQRGPIEWRSNISRPVAIFIIHMLMLALNDFRPFKLRSWYISITCSSAKQECVCESINQLLCKTCIKNVHLVVDFGCQSFAIFWSYPDLLRLSLSCQDHLQKSVQNRQIDGAHMVCKFKLLIV